MTDSTEPLQLEIRDLLVDIISELKLLNERVGMMSGTMDMTSEEVDDT